MKKKLLLFVLCGGLLLGLTGCGSNESSKSSDEENKYGSIIMTDGESLTLKELKEIKNTNEPKYQNNYQGQQVELTDKIAKIKAKYKPQTVCSIWMESITFEGGWEVLVPADYFDFSNLEVGDVLYVKSKVYEEKLYDIDWVWGFESNGEYGCTGFENDNTIIEKDGKSLLKTQEN